MNQKLIDAYQLVRQHSVEICHTLQLEDYVVQPKVFVSPPKWHLGHTTWFFENFLLIPFLKSYTPYDAQFNFVFNSYYETLGARVIRTDRGNLSRPTVARVYEYRDYVNKHIRKLLKGEVNEEIKNIFWIGINHEQQHQELLLTDIKFILGNNPLFPPYKLERSESVSAKPRAEWISIPKGNYSIGYHGKDFCFDNELNPHLVYLDDYQISSQLITNKEWMDFMEDGGYTRFEFWHADGWTWVNEEKIEAPLYWHRLEDGWHYYTLEGMKKVIESEPVCHISFYEAAAFAAWRGMRLPTEMEWEVASDKFDWGERWEWTNSAYLPYPGFSKAPGALGEYNGKFMVNQMVLRGASEATPANHSRATYRNFFQPELRWQFTGLRLAK